MDTDALGNKESIYVHGDTLDAPDDADGPGALVHVDNDALGNKESIYVHGDTLYAPDGPKHDPAN